MEFSNYNYFLCYSLTPFLFCWYVTWLYPRLCRQSAAISIWDKTYTCYSIPFCFRVVDLSRLQKSVVTDIYLLLVEFDVELLSDANPTQLRQPMRQINLFEAGLITGTNMEAWQYLLSYNCVMLKFTIFCARIGSLYKISNYNRFFFFINLSTNCTSSREGVCANHSGSALAFQLQLQHSYPPCSFSYEQCRKCTQLTIWTDWFEIRAPTWSEI